jgi:protoporphyrinogen oxidase
VAARFGYRLYRIFFKTYTEKVWGMPATSIQADWAAQRIKDLSLPRAVANALFPRRSGTTITTLIDRFQYPKLGPGMMWERTRDLVEAAGGEVVTDAPVIGVHRDGHSGRVVAVTACVQGREVVYPCTDVISSMPLPELVRSITPPAPASVIEATDDLRHRDFLTVALVVPEDAAFPDNWIYVHTPGVRVGRVQNFGSWSPYMVKEGWTCVGLEYFVNEGDDVWAMRDEDLIEVARTELVSLGLLRHPDGSTLEMNDIGAGYVERVPKAYPVYDDGYRQNVEVLRRWLERATKGVQAVGRNGMHRYNNQDHSMLTAMLAVRNVLGEEHDLWAVNLDEDYHEGGSGAGGRAAPVLPRAEEKREVAEVDAA